MPTSTVPGNCLRGCSTVAGSMPIRSGHKDKIPIQESAVEHRLQRGDTGPEDVSLGALDPTERSRKATHDAQSCRLFTRGAGDHDGALLGVDDCAAPTVLAGNNTAYG